MASISLFPSLLLRHNSPCSSPPSCSTISTRSSHLYNPWTYARRFQSRGFTLRRFVVCMAPDEEKMTRRSPLDFPIRFERSIGTVVWKEETIKVKLFKGSIKVASSGFHISIRCSSERPVGMRLKWD
eukprot:Gb_13759 [translate_table: standard]